MNENRCVCCDEVIPEGQQICPICEKGVDERPKRNIDRIREMTVEKLADFLIEITTCCEKPGVCRDCPLNIADCCNRNTVIKYLESEVSENDLHI